MKTVKQLIEDELQKIIHQLKEVSLLQEEKQALLSYKKELEQLLFLKKLSDTYYLEPSTIERIIVLPPPRTDFSNFRLVDDAETEEKQWWEELKIENKPIWLCEGDILIKKR
ncbi:cell-division protein [Capnocytophaga sp. 051621]|uniref:Cell-division protein n=1 Tax=Capnocytophaga periodontitidis TaxID=2795027 RepID=A0ABS0SQF0_9FLAO|nr:cell-division protein [Capnocytophaga periodontitidis]MBI1647474.1 cell-division protein [Capnocytophaga periodontitidis]